MRFLIQHLLEAAARAWPERPAVVTSGQVVSYRQLDRRANQFAHLLHFLGVGRGQRVGVCLPKGSASIAALYGVLRTGATYVPLDPAAPAARLAEIVADAGIRVVIVECGAASTWSVMPAASPLEHVVMPAGRAQPCPGLRVWGGDALHGQPTHPLPEDATSLDPAYILYTSGSTGRPKGVVHTHRSALAFIDWAVEAFGVKCSDRLASPAPLHFDLSVLDVFAAAGAGAAMIVVPRRATTLPVELARYMAAERITVWYSVPWVLGQLAMHGNLAATPVPDLRAILFAGEVFPSAQLRKLMLQLPHVRFANLFGPTETNVCTWQELAEPPADDEAIAIGFPVVDVQAFVVNGDGSEAATGEVGELWVRGATMMQGYWGDKRSPEEVFASSIDGIAGPLYRTGDLVRRDADGRHWFLGRRDSQVKCRGYRIELGEVERGVLACGGVIDCAVVALPDENGSNQLVAYATVEGALTGRDLARACARRLPSYMVPARFELCEALPRTVTGKIDRRRLACEPETSGEMAGHA